MSEEARNQLDPTDMSKIEVEDNKVKEEKSPLDKFNKLMEKEMNNETTELILSAKQIKLRNYDTEDIVFTHVEPLAIDAESIYNKDILKCISDDVFPLINKQLPEDVYEKVDKILTKIINRELGMLSGSYSIDSYAEDIVELQKILKNDHLGYNRLIDYMNKLANDKFNYGKDLNNTVAIGEEVHMHTLDFAFDLPEDIYENAMAISKALLKEMEIDFDVYEIAGLNLIRDLDNNLLLLRETNDGVATMKLLA